MTEAVYLLPTAPAARMVRLKAESWLLTAIIETGDARREVRHHPENEGFMSAPPLAGTQGRHRRAFGS
jgi:hypothetical protein